MSVIQVVFTIVGLFAAILLRSQLAKIFQWVQDLVNKSGQKEAKDESEKLVQQAQSESDKLKDVEAEFEKRQL